MSSSTKADAAHQESQSWGSRPFPDDYVNERGIPKVIFIEHVEKYLKECGMTAEGVLRRLQEDISKYRLIEAKLSSSRATLMTKLPEIRKTLEMLRHIQASDPSGPPMQTSFALSDTAFVDAEIDVPSKVGLWLGANVMVEYSVSDAISLLEKNYVTAQSNLERTLEDLAYLREQHIIMEVNMARVYNHEVRKNGKSTKELDAAHAK